MKCLFGHNWDGCKCSKCRKTRDEGHDWSKDCEKCSKCSATRNSACRWDGCKCTNCSKTRDEGHDWHADCEKCSRCGKTRVNAHNWSKDCKKCFQCGKTRDEEHDFFNTKLTCSKCGLSAQGNAKDKNGYTLLLRAVKAGRQDLIAPLIEKGADVNAADSKNQTPLHIAAGDWHENAANIIELLLARGADIEVRDSENQTPLHKAAKDWHNKSSIVELLLARGAEKDARDNQNRTPLHIGSADNRWEIVKPLLASGADPNARDNQNQTPLHLASKAYNAYIIKLLLASGADIEARDSENQTVLHKVAGSYAREAPRIVKELLASGAEKDARDSQNRTPLHIACEIGIGDIVGLLLSSGADRTAKSIEGKSVYDYAGDKMTILGFLSPYVLTVGTGVPESRDPAYKVLRAIGDGDETQKNETRKAIISLGDKANHALRRRLSARWRINKSEQELFWKEILLILAEIGDPSFVPLIMLIAADFPRIADVARTSLAGIASRWKDVNVPTSFERILLPVQDIMNRDYDDYDFIHGPLTRECFSRWWLPSVDLRDWENLANDESFKAVWGSEKNSEKIAFAEQVKSDHPDWFGSYYVLAGCHQRNKNYEEAESILRQGLKVARAKQILLSRLAEIRFDQDHIDDSFQYWVCSVRYQICTKHPLTHDAALYLMYIADLLGEPVARNSLREYANQTGGEQIILSREWQSKLCSGAKILPAECKQVLRLLDTEYLKPHLAGEVFHTLRCNETC